MFEIDVKEGTVIPIDKPRQWTSFQVVNKLKWYLKRTLGLKKIKIGHAGTLDPLASGLLLVCVGSATKQIESLQAGIKEYSGTIVFGATTPCFDLEQPIDAYYPYKQITKEAIDTARQSFIGTFPQIPPMFSAVKVNGQRAYISARDGSTADIKPKDVTVYDFTVVDFRPGNPNATLPTVVAVPDNQPLKKELYRNPQGIIPEFLPQMDFHITCSKGTYIRSIARDLGLALHSGAFLGALRMERIGNFRLEQAITIDDLFVQND